MFNYNGVVFMQVWGGGAPIAISLQGILSQKIPGGSRTPAWLPQMLVSEDHTWKNHSRKSPCPLLKRGGLATCLCSPHHLSPLQSSPVASARSFSAPQLPSRVGV